MLRDFWHKESLILYSIEIHSDIMGLTSFLCSFPKNMVSRASTLFISFFFPWLLNEPLTKSHTFFCSQGEGRISSNQTIFKQSVVHFPQSPETASKFLHHKKKKRKQNTLQRLGFALLSVLGSAWRAEMALLSGAMSAELKNYSACCSGECISPSVSSSAPRLAAPAAGPCIGAVFGVQSTHNYIIHSHIACPFIHTPFEETDFLFFFRDNSS